MGLFEDLKQAHLDEPCPKCKAVSGDKCVTPNGNKTSKPHADRIYNGNLRFQERQAAGYYDSKARTNQ